MSKKIWADDSMGHEADRTVPILKSEYGQLCAARRTRETYDEVFAYIRQGLHREILEDHENSSDVSSMDA